MKNYWLLLCIVLLILSLSACDADSEFDEDSQEESTALTGNAEGVPNAEEWLSDITSYIADSMDANNIPGLALAIVQGEDIILAEGYGLRDIAASAPVTTETLFHIGSTHKSMTSMLIAALVDDGVLDWDDPVVEYFPSFALSDPDATEEVTIRHLLSMTSGIPDDAEDELGNNSTPEEVLKIVAETALLGMPGEEFSYSNISASLGGYAGVVASGGDAGDLYAGYANLLQERILDPIGMDSATLSASEAQRNPDHAKSYVIEGDTAVLSASYDVDQDALAPSGSLKANVVEMASYVATQMNGGVAPNGNRIVSAETLAETWQPYLEDYGMGWEIVEYEGAKIILHTGAYDDFVSVIGFFPEYETGFVVLVNSEDAGSELIEEAPYALADILLEQ